MLLTNNLELAAILQLSLIGAVVACPEGCLCADKQLVCLDWTDESPPFVSESDDYETLDLSSGTDLEHWLCDLAETAGARDDVREKRAVVAAASDAVADADAGATLLGDALPDGRLPAAWLRSNGFVWLQRLRLRAAGLRLLHKDAFRWQLHLRCVDLARNRLRRLNVFTWRPHSAMHTLVLHGNTGLEIPSDGPMLYSDSLEVLLLSDCGIDSLSFSTFEGLPNLKKLDLSNNAISIISVGNSPSFPSGLNYLNIRGNEIQYLSFEVAKLLENITDVSMDSSLRKCTCKHMDKQFASSPLGFKVFSLMCSATKSSIEGTLDSGTCRSAVRFRSSSTPPTVSTPGLESIPVDLPEDTDSLYIANVGETSCLSSCSRLYLTLIPSVLCFILTIILSWNLLRDKVQTNGRLRIMMVTGRETNFENFENLELSNIQQ